MLTPDQLRAARAMARWSRTELAKRSGVAAPTIKLIENDVSDPKVSTLLKLRRALEQAGIQFVEDGAHSHDGGPGLRMRKAKR